MAAFNGRTFHSYAAPPLQKLNIMYITEWKKHLSTFEQYLRTEIPLTKISSLPVKERYLNIIKLFCSDPVDQKGTSAACSKTRAQLVVRAVRKNFSLEEEAVSSPRVAERSHQPSFPRDFCRLEK